MLTFKLNINRQTFNKNITTAEKSPIFTSHKSYSNSLCLIVKSRPHIQAHLVFADTQSPNKKPKELEFCQRSTETEMIC